MAFSENKADSVGTQGTCQAALNRNLEILEGGR